MKELRLLTIWMGVPVLVLGTAFLLRAEMPSVADLHQEGPARVTLDRRRAARELMRLDTEEAAIVALAKDDDVVIRREATRRLRSLLGERAVPLYKEALQDQNPLVRLAAVEELIAYSPRSDEVTEFLLQASSDADDDVRKLAASAAFYGFHRDYLPLRHRPYWDHEIEVVASTPLPLEGWRFRTDPGANGHVLKWFVPELDEAEWHDIAIGKLWDDALPDKVGHFEGIAWYRINFTAPPKPEVEFNEAVLHFEAVDESVWVWVNGQYAGSHDKGPGGYLDPFDVEVGSFITWEQPNQITVRVLNTLGAGGIYKPVEFQILR